jgi:hypothetical protein
VELVAVLRTQHRAGRALTGRILRLAAGPTIRKRRGSWHHARFPEGVHRPLPSACGPRDTVLFPAFRRLVGTREYADLGERFEDREHELFGKDGFEGMVGRVAKTEQALGLYDLARFTPPTP